MNRDFDLYICTWCGRTVRQPKIATYRVDTNCRCNFPNFIQQMMLVPEPQITEVPNDK